MGTKMNARAPRGPLAGLRVVEFAGIGPGPFACMLLSDMGADVVRVQRPGERNGATDIIKRGRHIVEADLKDPAARERVLRLLDEADVLVEGFRPGVMERLGLGPQTVAGRNPRLVYGRMTGWGQDGPLAEAAGHDINYISIAGALDAIGPAGAPPAPPLNLVGDYGGGSLYLVTGILAALYEARASGRGQVVDAAICDGTLSLMSLVYQQWAGGTHVFERGANVLDGGAPYYRAYRTADERYVSIGPIEPQFFALLCERLGVASELRDAQADRSRWPALAAEFERLFRTRTRADWVQMLEGSDACFAPVLSAQEAVEHPHLRARGALVEIDGVVQPAPSPRFSRTASAIQQDLPRAPVSIDDVLQGWRLAAQAAGR
ncbi:CoA transferase [Verticiella sediminum]|uniref:CoA transferase n=1 Tax=Verticiella sediminum TaxID=1247510 RepID=A0A556AJJ4_9BURK|nr:CaiB/BaiF CoA-transferase family protein [Verticiella sediminum]TSH93057.1 CoA transferase [Verticiella sediminum]